MKKIIWQLCYSACFLFVVVIFGASASELNNTVVVPSSTSWWPHSYITESQDLKGTDIELLRSVLAKMGYSLEFTKAPLKRLVNNNDKLALNANYATTYNSERGEKYYFSTPYRKEYVAIYYRDPKFAEMSSLNEIFEYANAISLNTVAYYGEEMEKLSKQYTNKLVHNETSERRMKQLVLGRVDIVLGDQENTDYLISKHAYKSVKRSSIMVVEQDVSFVFLKTSFDNKFIAEFNENLSDILK